MASDAGRSNALAWAVLGFLAGIAATLALLLVTQHHPRHHEETTVAAPVAPPPAPKVAEAKPPKPVAPKPAPAAPALATENTVDQQVQEDAAAAGMTSRRKAADAPTDN